MRIAWRLVMACVFAASAPSALAACSVGTQAVRFGPYNPIGGSALEGTGDITVTCDAGIGWSIALSSGSGATTDRTLTGANGVLRYNLYTQLAHVTVWGDGADGSSTVSGVGSGAAQHAPVYGYLPASQNVPVGEYADTIVVSVAF